MPDLGKKYTCYSCHTKFYDLGKPVPLCPKCGADQRDAEEAPTPAPSRSRSRAPVVVEEPVEEPEFTGEGEAAAVASDEDEEAVVPEREEPEEEDDEEEEEY
ncbi:MAG TPA: FYDLN acid domain-containing protein [Thermoanaerobaculia bacterium]|nr:FYDLN acid domain-containing protein [Thermoanaerobaculia bacterium]